MFWKNHIKLRFILIALFFAVGLGLTVWGWTMTGKLEGLGIMCLGLVSLLVSLFLYNARHK